ncbi:GyrI-like domain-containing protein [Nocardia sp. NPDC003345]
MTDHRDPTAEPVLIDTAETHLATVHGRIAPAGLPDFFDRSFGLLPGVILGQGAQITGPALCRYGSMSPESVELAVGFPVDRAIAAEGEVRAGNLPAARTARLVHYGAFDGLGESWDRLHTWIGDRDLTPGDIRWEVYLTEPSPDMDPDELRTELNWTVTARA